MNEEELSALLDKLDFYGLPLEREEAKQTILLAFAELKRERDAALKQLQKLQNYREEWSEAKGGILR